MQVVTIASHEPKEDYYSYQEFLASLKRFDIDPVILKDGYGGLGTKPVILRKAIQDGTIKDERIVFVDAFDVVFQLDPKGLPELTHLTFGAESNCFPDASIGEQFQSGPTPFRYLNSGFSFGPTDLYLKAINLMPSEELVSDKQLENGSWFTPNDQLTWQRMFLSRAIPMKLDVFANSVINLYGVEQDQIEERDGHLYYKPSGHKPFAFHMNGAKQPWKQFLKEKLKL
jgi:hypothetical protein